MTTISQRNTGSVWDKRARYIEQSTSALQRYVAMGDAAARYTKMKEYTPQQAREADISLYSRLLSDEQRTGPGKMPERSTSTAHTSETTGWGKKHLAISGVSHQPYVQTAHHSGAGGGSGLSMDNSSLVSGETPSSNYMSSWLESNESDFSSLKSIKTGSSASSEAAFSPWLNEPIPIVDEYHGVPLRSLYSNDVYEDEPVAPVTLFAPNVKYEETDPFDLNRASTSEFFPLNQSPRTPVRNGVTGRSKSRQRRLEAAKGIIKSKGQRVRFGTKSVRGMTPQEMRVKGPEKVGRGF
jgi:hypothetical protein